MEELRRKERGDLGGEKRRKKRNGESEGERLLQERSWKIMDLNGCAAINKNNESRVIGLLCIYFH